MDALSTQISSRRFETVKRGYDQDGVDSYLAKIGDQVGKLEDALRVARTRIEDLEHAAKDVSTADTVVRTAFLAAAESKAKLIAEAESKAKDIVEDAEVRAAQLGGTSGSPQAEALLLEARRRLEESERDAVARREQAEREAAEIIAAAKAKVAGAANGESEGEASEAADELSRLVETLGSLKEAARQGLAQAASLEADIEAVIAEH
jgi:DivIVA domain-containing protein